MSLSIRHDHHVADCEFTVFAVVENTRRNRQRRSSRGFRFVYDQSVFGPVIKSIRGHPAFYIGLHKRRFHIVISIDDSAAERAIREAVRIEENSRQQLSLISGDMFTLTAMTIMERVEYESQYRELCTILTSSEQGIAGTFSSVHWTGARNSFALHRPQSADPCLLCKTGLQHTIRVLRLGLGTEAEDASSREASFATWPVHMTMKAIDEVQNRE